MSGDKGRNHTIEGIGRDNLIGRALDAIQFVERSKRPFTRKKMAGELEINSRTALRWLYALEARGLVKHVSAGRPQHPGTWEKAGRGPSGDAAFRRGFESQDRRRQGRRE